MTNNFLVIFIIIFFLGFSSAWSDEANLEVTGVFYANRPMAIVNGEIVKEGDTINGAKILHIDTKESCVEFEHNGIAFTKTLGEGVKNKEISSKEKTANTESRTNWLNDYCTPYGKELYNATMKNYKKAVNEEGKNMRAKAFIHYEATLKYAQSAYTLVSSSQRNELNSLIELCRNKINLLEDEKQKMNGILDSLDLRSPQAISQWLKNNITYDSDVSVHTEGYWQTPEETIVLRTGDCEDFAFLAQALLRKISIHSTVLSIQYYKEGDQKHGHAICVFTDKGYYNCFSNANLHVSKKRSVSEFIDKIYPRWIKVDEINISDNSRRALFER